MNRMFSSQIIQNCNWLIGSCYGSGEVYEEISLGRRYDYRASNTNKSRHQQGVIEVGVSHFDDG